MSRILSSYSANLGLDLVPTVLVLYPNKRFFKTASDVRSQLSVSFVSSMEQTNFNIGVVVLASEQLL